MTESKSLRNAAGSAGAGAENGRPKPTARFMELRHLAQRLYIGGLSADPLGR